MEFLKKAMQMYYLKEAIEGNYSEEIFHIVALNMHCTLDTPRFLPYSFT